jgi:hypothetical protein
MSIIFIIKITGRDVTGGTWGFLDPIQDIDALFPPPKAMHYFGSLRHTLSRLKKDQRILRGWRKQKNYSVSSPGCGDPNRTWLRQDTTRASDAAKRRGSLVRQLRESFVCRRDPPKLLFCTSEMAQNRKRGGNEKLPALTQSFLVQRLYRQRRTDQVNSYESAIAPPCCRLTFSCHPSDN